MLQQQSAEGLNSYETQFWMEAKSPKAVINDSTLLVHDILCWPKIASARFFYGGALLIVHFLLSQTLCLSFMELDTIQFDYRCNKSAQFASAGGGGASEDVLFFLLPHSALSSDSLLQGRCAGFQD